MRRIVYPFQLRTEAPGAYTIATFSLGSAGRPCLRLQTSANLGPALLERNRR